MAFYNINCFKADGLCQSPRQCLHLLEIINVPETMRMSQKQIIIKYGII